MAIIIVIGIVIIALLGIWTELSATRRVLKRIERILKMNREDALGEMNPEARKRAESRVMWGVKLTPTTKPNGPYGRK